MHLALVRRGSPLESIRHKGRVMGARETLDRTLGGTDQVCPPAVFSCDVIEDIPVLCCMCCVLCVCVCECVCVCVCVPAFIVGTILLCLTDHFFPCCEHTDLR